MDAHAFDAFDVAQTGAEALAAAYARIADCDPSPAVVAVVRGAAAQAACLTPFLAPKVHKP
jgi:hypothetical protein